PYLCEGGRIIVNTQSIDPMPVITGAAQYPADIAEKLAAKASVTAIDALSLAKEAGNSRAVNVVLIGLMAKNTEIPYERWIETLKATVPPKFLDVNLKAFELGYNN
ncbi:MAG: 2-oxoacid:acceptor oxidoreductase family protein, partial [Clostridia bacterium]|nr:2-oxoacid:acceptor oxidoreductase family protein [Clostridia bacterium]